MTEYIERKKIIEVIKKYGKDAISDGKQTLDPVDDIVGLIRAVDIIPSDDVTEGKKAIEELAAEFCDKFCRYPLVCAGQDALDAVCETCPMNKLVNSAADVVEVVRCKECRFRGEDGICYKDIRGIGYKKPSDNDYCSSGKREVE